MTRRALPVVLLGLFTSAAADAPGPEDFVARLGAPRHADREAAGEAILKLGPAALPALARARESRDAEVRQRAETLASRIEAADVLKATPVRLALRDRPLAEAAEALVSGMSVKVVQGATGGRPKDAPPWPDRRVTLEDAGPVPFWDALDRLCGAGGLRRQYPPEGENYFPFRSPFALTLMPGAARPPASDTGALRVELLRVRHDRERNYAGPEEPDFSRFQRRQPLRLEPGTGALVGSSYQAELLVSAEPRLKIFGVGALEQTEAIDAGGWSLLETPTAGERQRELEMWRINPHIDPRLNPGLRYGSGSRSSRPCWPVDVPLIYPATPARKIARLRGVLPVLVLARRPDPLVIALKGAAGKTFSSGPTRITVHEVGVNSGREPTVELTLEVAPDAPGETMTVYDPKGGRLTVNRPIDLMELRFEVLDARGECCFWQYAKTPTERTHGRFAIMVHRGDNGLERPENLRLRYWEVIGAATDLRFSFTDVPTP